MKKPNKKIFEKLKNAQFNNDKFIGIDLNTMWSTRHNFVFFDFKTERIAFNNKKEIIIFSFDEILDYEVYENNNKFISSTFDSTLVGGALFGAGGAILGSSLGKDINENCKELFLQIKLKNIVRPEFRIYFIRNDTVSSSSRIYRKLKSQMATLLSHLNAIIYQNKQNKEIKNE